MNNRLPFARFENGNANCNDSLCAVELINLEHVIATISLSAGCVDVSESNFVLLFSFCAAKLFFVVAVIIKFVYCARFAGKPIPHVAWYRNEMVVTNKSVVLPSGGGKSHVRSELRVAGLGRRDVHSQLTCQAYNNDRTPPLSSTLHLDMNCKCYAKYLSFIEVT